MKEVVETFTFTLLSSFLDDLKRQFNGVLCLLFLIIWKDISMECFSSQQVTLSVTDCLIYAVFWQIFLCYSFYACLWGLNFLHNTALFFYLIIFTFFRWMQINSTWTNIEQKCAKQKYCGTTFHEKKLWMKFTFKILIWYFFACLIDWTVKVPYSF